jgi:NDP-sugar pyrophosphorylase family protein
MFCGVHLAWPRVLDVLPQPGGVIVESCINKAGYPAWMKQGARLDSFNHTGAFCDVGTPERLLEINLQLLAGRVRFVHSDPFARFTKTGFGWRGDRVRVHPSAILHGPVLLDDDAVIEAGAVVGPHVVVGKHCVVRADATVSRAVLQSGAVVHRDLHDAVVGTTCTLLVKPALVDAALA